MATTESLRKQAVPIPTKSPKARAAVCPNGGHEQTRIYSVKGKTRYCACDTCGHTWKQIVSDAEAMETDFIVLLADSLETSPTQIVDKVESVVLPVTEVKKIITELRALSVTQ
jgi:hypothetical protein